MGSNHTAMTRDGTEIHFQTHGERTKPAIFMGPHFFTSRSADAPPFTEVWIDRLKQDFFLITADYPRGVGRTGNPLGLAYTPDIAAAECERIADAAGVERFGWLGYSFGGALGVQLACRTARVAALVVGGFPPLNAPFRLLSEILATAAASSSASPNADVSVLWTAVGFYRPLIEWAERREVSRLTMPRLAFMGDEDTAQGLPEPGSAPLADNLRVAEPAPNTPSGPIVGSGTPLGAG
jgi:pimeloyl-ACP methyl ester carboxylesterase